MNRFLRPLDSVGRYVLFLREVFHYPGRWRVFRQRLVRDIWELVMSSVTLVLLSSFFVGAVIALEGAINLNYPILPKYLVGLGTRDVLLLEFSSTLTALLLAGKVGGSIASEIGSMRITEQIDALNVMGINSAAYLVPPKLVAALIFFPVLTLMSMIVGLVGGAITGEVTGMVSLIDYTEGLRIFFKPYYINYGLFKMVVFAFIIVTIPAFWGYYVEGGAFEVGRASTKGVVVTCIQIIVLNLILTQILLL